MKCVWTKEVVNDVVFGFLNCCIWIFKVY